MGKEVCAKLAPSADICNALGPLRDIVQSLADAEAGRIPAGPARKKLLKRLQTAGNAAVPTLVRSLASSNESVSSWAYFLLARLGGQRVVRKVSRLLEDPEIGDDVKVRALGLLSDLEAPVPPAVKLRDPDGLLEKSVRELVESLERDDDITQAVELILEQVPEAELPAFCGEVVKHGGAKARGLIEALCESRQLSAETVQALGDLGREVGRPSLDAEAHAALERGLEYLEAGKPQAARRRLERFVAANPMHAEGRSALGVCLLQLDAFDLAFDHLHEAARLEPDEPLHRWNLAAAAKQAERLGGAYLALREYLTLADDGDGAGERRTEARSFVRAYERMLRDSHPGVSLNDYLRGEELFARAYAALSEERPADAVRGFEAVLALVPRHYPSWGNLGAAYLQLDRKIEAERCLEHALELNPDYAVARKNLALLRA
jgi:tetratricopeptide (TPR) repeat protein